MAQVVLVRHGRPLVEGEEAARWGLSAEGRRAASALSQEKVWETIKRIHSSPEPMAQETAQIIGDARRIPVDVCEDLREVTRPYEAERYEDKLRAFLKGEAPRGWEAREPAVGRIRRGVGAVFRDEGDIGTVSHALLLTLFVAEVMEAKPTFWLHHSIGFCDYAIYDATSRALASSFRGAEKAHGPRRGRPPRLGPPDAHGRRR